MKKNRFITGYSGLRALAVIGVILYHLDPNTFVGGYLGVPIFFVLSGYLVTDHILKSYGQTGTYDYKGFYIKRIKRLYPQLISVLWLSAAWIILFQRNLLAKLSQIVITNLLNVYNIWQIFNGQSYFERFASNESPFTNLWTMSIDGQFYIIWPIVIFLLVKYVRSRSKIFWTIMGLTLVSALEMTVLYLMGADINRIYYGTDTRFFSLGLGAALAVIWPIEDLKTRVDKSDSRILDITGLIAFLIMLFLTFNSKMNPQTAFVYCGGMFIFSLFTTILIAVIAHPGSHWNNWLTNPLFNWLGSRSYGIYLYQFPVMIFFESKMPDIADHVILYRLLEIILILALSEATYRTIEKPFSNISWSDFLSLIKNKLILKNKTVLQNIQTGLITIIFLVGTIGIVVSPSVKEINFNKSQLAKRISINAKAQKESNDNLIKRLKREKRSKVRDESKLMKQARKDAKLHPVNKSYVKYGISQIDLQLAQKLEVTAIGDSVMAGSSNDLKQLMPKAIIDAAVSRQLNVAFGLIDNYKNQGVLTDNILIGLGTNGPFSEGDLDHLMKEVGQKRHVYWINTHVPSRPWQGTVNNLLEKSAKKYHNLTIIDWYGYSKKHPGWFYQDQTHPTPSGSKYYSSYIVKNIVEHSKF